MKGLIWLLGTVLAVRLVDQGRMRGEGMQLYEDSEHKGRIEQWIQWKNQGGRYDFHFNAIPARLAPENERYPEGLYMRGLPYYLAAVTYAVALTVYLVVRLRFRIWGGQAVKADYFTPARRYAPGVLCALGLFTFVSGGTVLLVASQHAHICMEKGLEATEDTAMLSSEVLIKLKQELVTVNMQHSEENPRFRVETSFLSSPTDNSLSILQDTDSTSHLTSQWEQKRLVLTLVLFSLGLVLFFISLLAFLLKVESLMFCFGISIAILGMLATALCGVYLGEIVGAGDYCEAVLKCVYEGGVPKERTGLGLFFRDFNSTNRISLLEGQTVLEAAHSVAVSALNSRLTVLYSETPIASYRDFTGSGKDAGTVRWAKTVEVVERAVEVRGRQDLDVMRRSGHVKEYCREAEEDVCDSVMDDLYLGFTGLMIVTVGCALSVCSGFSAPRLLEKWKKEDHQKQLGKYNLYGM